MADEKTTRNRRPIVVAVVVVLLLAGFLIFRFGPFGPGGGDPAKESHSSKVVANTSASRSATVVNGDGDVIDLRTIAVINRSRHPVMSAVARRLAEDLRTRDIARSVELYDATDPLAMPEPGGELASSFITLDLSRFDETGDLRHGRTVDATLDATIGPDLWDSRHGYTDHLSPPFVRANASVTIEHHSVTTRSASPDGEYAQLIDNLAAKAIEQVNGQIAEWAAEHGRLAKEPEGLMPSYRPVPEDLPLPDDPTLTRVISGHQLMAHNHTVWTVESSDPAALLADLRDRLASQGWRAGNDSPGKELSHIRISGPGGARVFEAFSTRPPWDRSTTSGPGRVVIRYLDRMTREEMEPVFERWIEDETVEPLSLIPFERSMTHDLRERLWDQLAERTDLPLAAELRVIGHLDDRGDHAEARTRLDHARLLALFEARDLREKLDELTEDIGGGKNPASPAPTDAQLEAIGAVPLVSGATVSAEVGLDQPAKFYRRLPDQLVLLAVTVTRATIPEGTYKLVFTDCTPGPGGGGNMSTTPHHPKSPWSSTAAFNRWEARATEVGSEQFRVDLTSRDVD